MEQEFSEFSEFRESDESVKQEFELILKILLALW